MRNGICFAVLFLAQVCTAAERKIDFSELTEGQAPQGFRSTVTGKGKPGDWKVIREDVPSLMPSLNGQPSSSHSSHLVLAQLAQDPADEHFPLLIYDVEKFGDFSLTTRFKTMRGVIEQMAGVAFRVINESNYYVVRASSLGNTFRFYKVLDGQRGPPVGPDIEIPLGTWHDLTVDCKGNQIKCLLDGKELISVTDKANAITSGKIGFWTKSDSVSYFGDTVIRYTPFETSAQKIVREIMQHYPRLLGVKVYITDGDASKTRIIASADETELGRPGAKTEQEVIGRGETYYGREKDVVSVIMPLRDRNGDAMAAVRIVMKTFPGQTEENAIIRATPIVRDIQSKAHALDELME
ncbi:MAG TPA: family 16 glycoside hydrolase [Verrucomicrobiae bacterium]|nr:family 16 glycoside hydrolase [Verrucomicrobiae bacterium]